MELFGQTQHNDTFRSVDSNGPSVTAIVLECNKVAMEHLRNDNFTAALDLLKKAEQLLLFEYKQNYNESVYRLVGITLNNLGCYHKRTEKPKVALRYLKKALQVESATVNDPSNLAGTHLNICAILSHMSQHEEALHHAELAIGLLQDARKSLLTDEKGEYLMDPDKVKNSKEVAKFDYIKGDSYRTIITTIIIGYYNSGTELEHLKRFHLSVQAYSIGHELAVNELGDKHPLTQNLAKNVSSLIEKKRDHEEIVEKKNSHKLRLFELNKGIRYQHMRAQQFELYQENPPRKKVIEYGFDGHKQVKTCVISRKHAQKRKQSPDRAQSVKLPRITAGAAQPVKKTRLNSRISQDPNMTYVTEYSNFEQQLKSYYDTMFTPKTTTKPQNKIIVADSPGPRETFYGNRSSTKRGNVSKAFNYGHLGHDSDSFFRSIDNQIKDLEFKITKTKGDISSIANQESTVQTIPTNVNSLPTQQERFILENAETPTLRAIVEGRSLNSRGRPTWEMQNPSPSLRPSSVESSKRSYNVGGKRASNGSIFSFQQGLPVTSHGSQRNDQTPNRRISGEDNEPPMPGGRANRLPARGPVNRITSADSDESYSSPLFDIAQEIEKRSVGRDFVLQPGINTHMLIDSRDIVKEEVNEENNNQSMTVLRKKPNGVVIDNPEYDRPLLNPIQRNIRGEKEMKSIDKQISEVRKSLDYYKKELQLKKEEQTPQENSQKQMEIDHGTNLLQEE